MDLTCRKFGSNKEPKMGEDRCSRERFVEDVRKFIDCSKQFVKAGYEASSEQVIVNLRDCMRLIDSIFINGELIVGNLEDKDDRIGLSERLRQVGTIFKNIMQATGSVLTTVDDQVISELKQYEEIDDVKVDELRAKAANSNGHMKELISDAKELASSLQQMMFFVKAIMIKRLNELNAMSLKLNKVK